MGSLPVLDVMDCSGDVEMALVLVVGCKGVAILPGLAVRSRGEVGTLLDLGVVAKKASVRGVKETGARGGGGGGLRRT
jgi:hypothetical protein